MISTDSDRDVDAIVARYFAGVGRRYGALILGAAITLVLAVGIPVTRARNPPAQVAGRAPIVSSGTSHNTTADTTADTTAGPPSAPPGLASATSPAAAPPEPNAVDAYPVASVPFAAPSASTTTATSEQSSSKTEATAAPSPLQIAQLGWATTDAPGTAAATAGVPDGDLPVAVRVGQTTKYSYARLHGTQTVLTLAIAADPGANQLDTQAAVKACRALDPGWKAGPAQDMASAPRFDTANCRPGTRNGDVFTFDFTGISDITDAAGVVFVPAAGAGPAFQVVLAPTAR